LGRSLTGYNNLDFFLFQLLSVISVAISSQEQNANSAVLIILFDRIAVNNIFNRYDATVRLPHQPVFSEQDKIPPNGNMARVYRF
jgi:hypothetical protein